MNADHGIDVIALPVSVLGAQSAGCWPWELCRKGKVETKQNTGKHLPAAGDHHSQHLSIIERPCLICSYHLEANFGVTILVVMLNQLSLL